LGGDVFSGLKQAGVEYEKGKGFKFTQSTNIRRATTILSEALGQKVEFEGAERGKPCFICGNPVQRKEEESERTLCDECINHEDAYSLYVMKFQQLLDNVLER
jgi:hypothetical protein